MEISGKIIESKTPVSIKEISVVLGVLCFAIVLRLPSLTQPLGPDQGVMAVIGSGVLEGKIPYRDFWEMGSPAIFFTYALVFKLFGTTMAAIPIADILISLITTLLIYLLCRSVWNKQVGYISALLFTFFSNGVRLGMHSGGDIAFGTFWYILQRESCLMPLITAAFLLVLRSEKIESHFWKYILPGFLCGLSFVYKFPSLIFFACIVVYVNRAIFLNRNSALFKKLIIKNITLLIGFSLALVPFILFFTIKGVFKEMTDIIFGYVSSVYGQMHHSFSVVISTGLRRTFFLAQENYILWIFFLAAPMYIFFNDRKKEHLLLAAWAIASIIYVISHREFFGYHYLVTLPPFAILAGYGIYTTVGPKLNLRILFTTEIHKTIIIFILLANIFTFTALIHAHYTKFIFFVTKKITREEYYSYFNAFPKHDFSFPSDYQISSYIKENTNPDELIYVLGGIEGVIYFLSERKSPSRFVFSWIIFYFAHGKVKEAEIYRQELLNDLKTKPPKYLITVKSLESFKEFNNIYTYLNKNYTLDKTFPDERFVYIKNNYIQ